MSIYEQKIYFMVLMTFIIQSAQLLNILD